MPPFAVVVRSVSTSRGRQSRVGLARWRCCLLAPAAALAGKDHCRVIYFDGAAGFASNDEVQFRVRDANGLLMSESCEITVNNNETAAEFSGRMPELWGDGTGLQFGAAQCAGLPNIDPDPTKICAGVGLNGRSCSVKYKFKESNGVVKKGPLLEICCYEAAGLRRQARQDAGRRRRRSRSRRGSTRRSTRRSPPRRRRWWSIRSACASSRPAASSGVPRGAGAGAPPRWRTRWRRRRCAAATRRCTAARRSAARRCPIPSGHDRRHARQAGRRRAEGLRQLAGGRLARRARLRHPARRRAAPIQFTCTAGTDRAAVHHRRRVRHSAGRGQRPLRRLGDGGELPRVRGGGGGVHRLRRRPPPAAARGPGPSAAAVPERDRQEPRRALIKTY